MKKLLFLVALAFFFSSCVSHRVLIFKRGSTCNQHDGYVGYEESYPHHAPKPVKRKSY